MNGVSGSSVARGAQTAEEPHRDPQLAFSRLGINIAVERYEEGCADSQDEDDISQRVDRARVAHDPPARLVILAVFSARRVQRGDDNNGQRDEQLHDEEKLGQQLITTSQVLRDVVPVLVQSEAKQQAYVRLATSTGSCNF